MPRVIKFWLAASGVDSSNDGGSSVDLLIFLRQCVSDRQHCNYYQYIKWWQVVSSSLTVGIKTHKVHQYIPAMFLLILALLLLLLLLSLLLLSSVMTKTLLLSSSSSLLSVPSNLLQQTVGWSSSPTVLCIMVLIDVMLLVCFLIYYKLVCYLIQNINQRQRTRSSKTSIF